MGLLLLYPYLLGFDTGAAEGIQRAELQSTYYMPGAVPRVSRTLTKCHVNCHSNSMR